MKYKKMLSPFSTKELKVLLTEIENLILSRNETQKIVADDEYSNKVCQKCEITLKSFNDARLFCPSCLVICKAK
jgi:protein-arginine kinase activator protein McsA